MALYVCVCLLFVCLFFIIITFTREEKGQDWEVDALFLQEGAISFQNVNLVF